MIWRLALLILSTPALASAVPTRPAPVSAYGCGITLPDPDRPGDPGDPIALQVRSIRPVSSCDPSAPVAWGASVRDGVGGRR